MRSPIPGNKRRAKSSTICCYPLEGGRVLAPAELIRPIPDAPPPPRHTPPDPALNSFSAPQRRPAAEAWLGLRHIGGVAVYSLAAPDWMSSRSSSRQLVS